MDAQGVRRRSAEGQLRHLRLMLYSLSILVFVASIVELLAAKHDQELTQFIPFAISGIGIVTVVMVWHSPSWWMTRWTQGFMLVSLGASLLGMYFHISGNMEFVRELHPDASLWTAFQRGFTGRNPILAPGVLAFGAALALLGSLIRIEVSSARPAIERM